MSYTIKILVVIIFIFSGSMINACTKDCWMKNKNFDVETLNLLYKYNWKKHCIAHHPAVSDELVQKLLKDDNVRIRQLTITSKHINTSFLKKALKKNELIKYVACNPTLPNDLILKWFDNVLFRRGLALNPLIPQKTIDKLMVDKDDEVRINLAGNLKLPSVVLSKLSKDIHEFVRYCIARNQNTPKNSLLALAHDKSSMVRSAVAGNSNISMEIVRILSNDIKDTVRLNLLNNKNLNVHFIDICLQTKYCDLLYGIIAHKNTSNKQIENTLNNIKCKDAYIAASENPNLSSQLAIYILEKFSDNQEDIAINIVDYSNNVDKNVSLFVIRHGYEDAQSIIAEKTSDQDIINQLLLKREKFEGYISTNSFVSSSVLESIFYKTEDIEVQINIAKHPNIKPNFLNILLKSQKDYIRTAAASNPSLGDLQIEKLYSLNDESILKGIAKNPRIPDSMQLKLLEQNFEIVLFLAENMAISDATIWHLADKKNPEILSAISSNRNISNKTLKKILRNLYLCKKSLRTYILEKLFQ